MLCGAPVGLLLMYAAAQLEVSNGEKERYSIYSAKCPCCTPMTRVANAFSRTLPGFTSLPAKIGTAIGDRTLILYSHRASEAEKYA